jgi:hypothetical protein
MRDLRRSVATLRGERDECQRELTKRDVDLAATKAMADRLQRENDQLKADEVKGRNTLAHERTSLTTNHATEIASLRDRNRQQELELQATLVKLDDERRGNQARLVELQLDLARAVDSGAREKKRADTAERAAEGAAVLRTSSAADKEKRVRQLEAALAAGEDELRAAADRSDAAGAELQRLRREVRAATDEAAAATARAEKAEKVESELREQIAAAASSVPTILHPVSLAIVPSPAP